MHLGARMSWTRGLEQSCQVPRFAWTHGIKVFRMHAAGRMHCMPLGAGIARRCGRQFCMLLGVCWALALHAVANQGP